MNFTEKVHVIVRKIPKGKVLTYKEVAMKIGHPNSARAVGTILKKNYDPSIPCHRVIRSDGKIGNYNRGGMSSKQKLLKKEGYLPAGRYEIKREARLVTLPLAPRSIIVA